MNWHPLRFRPIYMERVWGGRRLADLYGRDLPPARPIGESWEIADRADDASVVADGPLAGRTLPELMAADAPGLLGAAAASGGRFPLLVKILDAREVLSLQVHPPVARAVELGGEPKTEMWYFTATDPGAEILVGLRHGITRADFVDRLEAGTVADCFHHIRVARGDAMFLPSGRVHALGAGLVLFEIQENSDTTYRVFDWNRRGLDGRPRPLHVRESLESINFEDFEPSLIRSAWTEGGGVSMRLLVEDARFRVESVRARTGATIEKFLQRATVIGVVQGWLELEGGSGGLRLAAGDFCLLPAALGRYRARALEDTEWLTAEPGGDSPVHV